MNMYLPENCINYLYIINIFSPLKTASLPLNFQDYNKVFEGTIRNACNVASIFNKSFYLSEFM